MYTAHDGRVQCNQFTALLKRTQQQCRAPAINISPNAAFMGRIAGSETGRAKQGRLPRMRPMEGSLERSVKRSLRSANLIELYELEALDRELGRICGTAAECKPSRWSHKVIKVKSKLH